MSIEPRSTTTAQIYMNTNEREEMEEMEEEESEEDQDEESKRPTDSKE